MDLKRLERMPTIKSVMTPFPHSVDLDAPVSEAQAIMAEHDVRHVPVQHGGRLRGIVTHRDIALVSGPDRPRAGRQPVTVRQVCTTDPYVVDDSEPVDRVLQTMAGRHVGSVLVVRNGKLVGIFTATDACRVLGDLLRARFRRPGDDAA